MMAKRKKSGRKATVKTVKKLARRTRVPATKVHESKGKRKNPRTLEEHLKEEGW